MKDKIIFTNNRFDAVLCLNGEISHFDYIAENKGKIYCADGAANTLISKYIIPDYIIGDLDSVNVNEIKTKSNDIKIIEKPSQEKNDFEKVLDFLISEDKKNILIFGFQGGELEHTLNNWSVLKKIAKQLNIIILHNDRYALPIHKSIEIELKANEIISIIPQATCNIKTKGLKWELNNETLEIGTREGARNIAISEKVTIDLNSGEYLMFIDSRYPYSF